MDELKNKIRSEVLKKRLSLKDKEVNEKSLLIKERLFKLKEFREAQLIMFYASFKNEVRTNEMIEDAISLGKKIALPNISKRDGMIKAYLVYNLKKDLSSGLFGIPEPKADKEREVNTKEIDMIVVPGIAFDKKGNRVGFGKGFYDRFLYSLRTRQGKSCTRGGAGPFCVGLSFEMQIVDDLPSGRYDEMVDMVITEGYIVESQNEL